jgi:hypothetical protein
MRQGMKAGFGMLAIYCPDVNSAIRLPDTEPGPDGAGPDS